MLAEEVKSGDIEPTVVESKPSYYKNVLYCQMLQTLFVFVENQAVHLSMT